MTATWCAAGKTPRSGYLPAYDVICYCCYHVRYHVQAVCTLTWYTASPATHTRVLYRTGKAYVACCAKDKWLSRLTGDACCTGTPKKPATGADIKANNPDQPHVAALQSDMALDGQLQQFVTAPQGLFPAPLPSHQLAGSKVLSHFKLLGRAMAKALQDNRLLDLPLSYVFYRYKAYTLAYACQSWSVLLFLMHSEFLEAHTASVICSSNDAYLAHLLCCLANSGTSTGALLRCHHFNFVEASGCVPWLQ